MLTRQLTIYVNYGIILQTGDELHQPLTKRVRKMLDKLIKEEKKVEYLELIYDLIFVYIIGRNNSLLHHTADGRIQPAMFVAYVLCTLAVIQIWNYTTYYINLFGKNGLREHIFLFTNMFLLYFIGEGTREHWEVFHAQYHFAWALILINIALQYIIEYHSHKDDKALLKNIRQIITTLLTEAVMVFAMIPLYKNTGTDLSYIPILFGITVTMITGRGSENTGVDFTHLTERAMLYVVFTFGEMVIAISGYFEGDLDMGSLYFSLMAFLIVVGLFLSYGTLYDHVIDREMQNDGLVYMLIHILLIFGLNNITTSLEFMREESIELLPKVAFLCGAFLMYYVPLFFTRHYAKRSCIPPLKFYLKIIALTAGFVILMFVFREVMWLNILISVIYVYLNYIIIYRLGRFNRG